MLRKKLKLNNATSDEDASTSNKTTTVVKIIKNPVPVQYSIVFEKMLWEKLWCIEEALCVDLMSLDYKKDKRIAAIYNPLDYASDLHKNYLRKFLKKTPIILFLGMNSGPFGMCQTGVNLLLHFNRITTTMLYNLQVPFGNVSSVKKWMKLEGVVKKPKGELTQRQIDGLNCKREEQSGKRFWGVLEELCGVSENFFHQCYVHNLCPLAFLESSGKNITPPEIKVLYNVYFFKILCTMCYFYFSVKLRNNFMTFV